MGLVSLEGRLRELALLEVLQLLGLSRKTGTLQLHARVVGRAGFIRLEFGAVVDAESWALDEPDDEMFPIGLASSANGARAVEQCVLDLLTWRDGDFRFLPADRTPPSTPVRLPVELLLVEAAQRAESWSRLEDRVPHAQVIPAFVDVEPQQLPLLRLAPQEWEVLTRVDGMRDLSALAIALGRDLIDVASIVHGLIGSGLLTLRESESVPRRHPTPPISITSISASLTESARATNDAPRDLWIPHGDDARLSSGGHADDDSLFDPIATGVMSADGVPRLRTAPTGVIVMQNPAASLPISVIEPVATTVAETSLQRGETAWPMSGMQATSLCSHGDDAARRGDLAGALTFWSAALRSEASIADADRVREAIALAARLHALLHPATARVPSPDGEERAHAHGGPRNKADHV